MGEFIYNIGKVTLRNNECFWIFPEYYFYNSCYNICSPWFSYMEEQWNLVKLKGNLKFRLWRNNLNLSKHEYSVQLSLENRSCENCKFTKCTTDINSDYGCELEFSSLCSCEQNYHRTFTQNGLVKLYFDVQIKETINVASRINNEVLLEDNEKSRSEAESNEVEEEKVPEAKGIDRLVKDLKNLLSNGQRSDITLKVGDREFKVHRNILIVRSPVFASMLQHDTKESATGIVDIPDCSEKAFDVFLSYIYTGSVDTMSSDNIFHLYYAADKYQVNDLKSECVEYMEKNLSIQNFCAVMTLSLVFSESSLQKKATKFFCDNVKVIIKTVQWQNYVKDYPIQANELFIKAMNA